MRGAWALVIAAACGSRMPSQPPPDDARADGPVDAPVDVLGIDAPVREVAARLIAGGGIDDAPIASVVNVYVIDAVLQTPIASAHVEVGGVTGTTDATGLYTARGGALQGPQQVFVEKSRYRAEIWLGVAGANVTIPMRPLGTFTVPSADLSGTFTGFHDGLPPLASNHVRGGSVTSTMIDGPPYTWVIPDSYPARASCRGITCDFTVAARTGRIALFGATYDIDTKNTPTLQDDTSVLQTYNVRTGITVVGGVMQSGQDLTQVDRTTLVDATVEFDSICDSEWEVAGVGIDLPGEGIVYLNGSALLASPTVKSPPLSLFPGAQYHVMGFAGDNHGASCIVVKRGGLALGTWMRPPTLDGATRTGAVWTSTGTYGGVIYFDETANEEILEVLAFDAASTVTMPAVIPLPTGPMTARAVAYRASWDNKSFSFANDAVLADARSESGPIAVP